MSDHLWDAEMLLEKLHEEWCVGAPKDRLLLAITHALIAIAERLSTPPKSPEEEIEAGYEKLANDPEFQTAQEHRRSGARCSHGGDPAKCSVPPLRVVDFLGPAHRDRAWRDQGGHIWRWANADHDGKLWWCGKPGVNAALGHPCSTYGPFVEVGE